MSRKNPFATLDLSSLNSTSASGAKTGYGMTGAAKTVVRSIEEMAENTKRLLDGETIIDLPPTLVSASRILDRLQAQDEDYEELKGSLKEHGQTSPILVRPDPEQAGRYIVVFGHRRLRAAIELGIPVKAVVKTMDDIASAIAQGQENSARSNLSFIERAFFARNMLDSGLTKAVVKSSIGIDDAMLSKMLNVIEVVPAELLDVLGASKKIGRDKWLSLRQLLLNPAYKKLALNHTATREFQELGVEQRFDDLHGYLKRYKTRSTAKTRKKNEPQQWESADKLLVVATKAKPKGLSVEFTNENGKAFGSWLTENLERFYETFQKEVTKHGD